MIIGIDLVKLDHEVPASFFIIFFQSLTIHRYLDSNRLLAVLILSHINLMNLIQLTK